MMDNKYKEVLKSLQHGVYQDDDPRFLVVMQMSGKDKEFLKNLQYEMLTQDTVCQADPRFWVVMQTERVYGIEDGYDVSGSEILYEYESIGESFDDLLDWVRENCDDLYIEDDGGDIHIYDCDDDLIDVVCDTEDLLNLLNYRIGGFEIVNYREVDVIKENTMFLTLRECKEHIERNHHHYNSTAHPYAMTAWRSPQVERLYRILQNTNWEAIICAE